MQARTRNNNVRAEVLEVIREMPGLTSTEIASLMPHASKSAVTTAVHGLKTVGVIEVQGTKQMMRSDGHGLSVPTYVLSANPTPNVVKFRRKQPSEAALHMRLREANEKIEALEAWKREAIARYPDLGVEPIVLRARKLVAEELRASGDHALAEQVIAGTKDATLMVRVTLKALEEGE